MINITNECNMPLMARYPDKYFDLAIVDPPYGIGEDGKSNHSRCKLAKAKIHTKKLG
jgi:site-specific DNA-methyltransferase (adenine-specific)